jgi:hypothetical protein
MYTGKGIDRNEFNECFEHTEGRVKYELGAKPPLGSDSSSFDKSDCSGFTRWLFSRTFSGFTDAFPDGSANQHAWCKLNIPNIGPGEYSDALTTRNNSIYICFMDQKPDTDEVTRHVWFLQNGSTIECCGGDGVTSSEEHARAYADRCSGCYLVRSYVE